MKSLSLSNSSRRGSALWVVLAILFLVVAIAGAVILYWAQRYHWREHTVHTNVSEFYQDLAEEGMSDAKARLIVLKDIPNAEWRMDGLNKRYSRKEAEIAIRPTMAQAEIAHSRAVAVDRKQGMATAIDATSKEWINAKAAYKKGDWKAVDTACAAVVAQSDDVLARDAERTAAREAQNAALVSKAQANFAEAPVDARDLYQSAAMADNSASTSFERGDFTDASASWKRSERDYAGAAAFALAVRERREQKIITERTMIAVHPPIWEEFYPQQWTEIVDTKASADKAPADTPKEGTRLYNETLDLLAKLYHKDPQMAELWGLLVILRDARDQEKWPEVHETAEKLLAKKEDWQEVVAAKVLAEKYLQPIVRFTVSKPDGELVPATIRSGRSTELAPRSYQLEPGKTYTFNINYQNDNERKIYLAKEMKLKADWMGVRNVHVSLIEMKDCCYCSCGCSGGHGTVMTQTVTEFAPQMADASRMVFRWIPPGQYATISGKPKKSAIPKVVFDIFDYNIVTQTNTVTLTQGFWVSETKVTQAQWEEIMGTTVQDQLREALADDTLYDLDGKKQTIRRFLGASAIDAPERWIPAIGPDYPMVYVNYHEAQAFCDRLTQEFRRKGILSEDGEIVLMTEAQWYYLYHDRSLTAPRPVFDDRFIKVKDNPANSYLVYGVSQGASEWCLDWFETYHHVDKIDPYGPIYGTLRLTRGANWNTRHEPRDRIPREPTIRLNDLGFRVVCIVR